MILVDIKNMFFEYNKLKISSKRLVISCRTIIFSRRSRIHRLIFLIYKYSYNNQILSLFIILYIKNIYIFVYFNSNREIIYIFIF